MSPEPKYWTVYVGMELSQVLFCHKLCEVRRFSSKLFCQCNQVETVFRLKSPLAQLMLLSMMPGAEADNPSV